MKSDWSHLEPHRKTGTVMGGKPGELQGVFYFRRGSAQLVVIASTDGEMGGEQWEHVSGRVVNIDGSQRVPSWAEMCWLKSQFWEEEETVVQFHPPKSEYVNCHPHVLHLWRPVGAVMPRPNANFVGPVV